MGNGSGVNHQGITLALELNSQGDQDLAHALNIHEVRDIANAAGLRTEEGTGHHHQGRIFCPADRDLTRQGSTASDLEDSAIRLGDGGRDW